MKKYAWIFALFNFIALSIVEDGVGDDSYIPADEGAGSDAHESDVNDAEIEATSPEEAVLETLGLEESTSPKDAKTEESKDEDTSGDVTAEQKEKEITQDDLAPLNSRNPVANERFQKITEGYKQEKARAEHLAAEVEQYRGTVDSLRQLGFGDEQSATDLVNFSQYRDALYKGDVQTFEAIIADQIRQFEVAHGRKVSVNANILDMHQDLKSRVDSLDIDEETAFELARSRTLQGRAQRESHIRAQNSMQAAQTQQMLDGSVSKIEQMQNGWASTDPDYQSILPYLQPQMQEIGSKFPPHMWPEMVALQYQTIKKSLAASNQATRRQQPLRGNGFGSATPVANSPVQAVLQAMNLPE